MRRLWLIFAQAVTLTLGILFVLGLLRPGAGGDDIRRVPSQATSASYADAVARAAPAVVNVYSQKRVRVPLLTLPEGSPLQDLLGQLPGLPQGEEESTSLGSGVLVGRDGHVLTNYHVIEAADEIAVMLVDGREVNASLVGADPDTDLAILHIDVKGIEGLDPARQFRTEGVRVGDIVLAIGNPFGVGQTTSLGIVSALGRDRLGINTYENFIQTDAAINPGSSGGALIDADGRLVGINTAIFSRTGGSLGIGFAIPAATVRQVMEQLLKQGVVQRGWLGIEPQDMTPDLAQAFGLSQSQGVLVAAVLRDGPAHRGGLRPGDIVNTLNRQQVRDTLHLLNLIASQTPGALVELDVLREGAVQTLKVVAGQRPGLPVAER
ncbi:MAG: trypsin-like peptidase domain-containing protein [Corticimicrobacter sp.]|uniref:S1C family serine protease n=1 Tax=Corticimicrobacter sp. TaxID=2678536 RepID=UPI0032DB8D37